MLLRDSGVSALNIIGKLEESNAISVDLGKELLARLDKIIFLLETTPKKE